MLKRISRRLRTLLRRDELEIEQNIATPRGSALRRAAELRRLDARRRMKDEG
jgi:hypothetical protein